jgi:hypothetical protein
MKRLLVIAILGVAACSPEGAETTPLQIVDVTPRPAATVRATAEPAAAPPAVEVYYANCDAVRAAGQDPLSRGDPGYRAGLDRDDDGQACE